MATLVDKDNQTTRPAFKVNKEKGKRKQFLPTVGP